MSDLIDRQLACETLSEAWAKYMPMDLDYEFSFVMSKLRGVPSAQPEIIRCKDCRWWDKYGNYDNGYCMAAKHGHWSEHWEIIIRRTYKGDFYCADAEPKGEQENE